ncbi:MAG: hypothetical protein ACYCXW_18645 [Solirubrobacteraceae bacterium]
MTSTYQQQLGRELTAVGIRGALHRRIVAEIDDHLECDPDALLGEPRALAQQFADVIGSARAKTAAVAAFASLVVAGVVTLVIAVATGGTLRSAQRAGGPLQGPTTLATVAAAVAVIAVQVALASGLLVALRWLWRRNTGVLPAAEARIIVRRAILGVGAGITGVAAIATAAVAERHVPGTPSAGPVIGASAVGVVALLAAVPSLRAATRLRPLADGPAGDVLDDLGPLAPAALHDRPWRVALLVAIAIALLATVAGILQADPYDGAARGIVDGLACLAGFATLGPWLGLWSRRRRGLPA